MRHFEQEIFIRCARRQVYEHLAEPGNLIGLQPLLTSLEALPERRGENGIILRPFHTVETFRWLGIPIMNNRIYSVAHLTDPYKILKHVVQSKPSIETYAKS